MNTKSAMDALRAANPVETAPSSLDPEAERELARILATAAAPEQQVAAAPARRPIGRLALAGGALAVLTAMALVVPAAVPHLGSQPSVAYAATPDPLRVLGPDAYAEAGLMASDSAHDLLMQIAETTAGLPDDSGDGRYARIHTEGWSLWTRVDGEQVTSEVVPQISTSWTAADGSGRHVIVRDGETVEDRIVGPGTRALMWPMASLSDQDDRLAGQLEAAHPVSNGPAERLVAVLDAAAEQPQRPSVRAAVLRYLAATPGLEATGMVVDRAGRTGLAVHVSTTMSGMPERRTIVIDPSSGRILGAETTLTEDAGKLNVPIPSVISYGSFLSSGYVNGIR